METNLYIHDWASISPLGHRKDAIWKAYKQNDTQLTWDKFWQGPLSKDAKTQLAVFLDQAPHLKKVDRTAQMGCFVAEQLKLRNKIHEACAVNAGSSRGATGSLESNYHDFFANGEVSTQSSPLTTAGNIASFMAQQIQSQGVEISHSITCSTFSHGLANANAWLAADMAEEFMVAGTEAPLTPFTFAQMQALGIYTSAQENALYPCRAYDLEKVENTMALGEGAIAFLLSTEKKQAKYKIAGIGMSKEVVKSAASVSLEGLGTQKAMLQAMAGCRPEDIDVIISHSPGTVQGDKSEANAIQAVFKNQTPAVTNNKWKIGHTFGASAGFSLEMGLLMLENNAFISNPLHPAPYPIKEINMVLINSIGFGGNAISLLLTRS